MDDAAMLTVKEVSQRLGISRYQVYRRITRGDLKAVQVHRGNVHYLVGAEDLAAYIAAGGGDVLTGPKSDNTIMLRVSQVALMTGFTEDTVRRICYSGRLPYIKGKGERGHLRIPRAAVEEMIGATAS